MSAVLARPAERSRRALLPLLRELGDLKRITSAGRPGSIAERAFRAAWAALAAGQDRQEVALAVAGRALAAARLGDLDAATLAELGLPDPYASEPGPSGVETHV